MRVGPPLEVEIKATDQNFNAAIASAQRRIKGFENETNNSLKSVEGMLGRLRTAVLSFGAAWVAFRAGRSIVEAGMQVQALQNRMVAATGDIRVAAEALAFARQESNRLGLDFRNAADGYAGFAASGLRAGLTFQQTKEIFTGVSEAAVSMRLSAEQTALVFKALEQIAGKGTVSMEELRGQLGDALPGAFEIAAKAMGVTTAQFAKMVANGEVVSSEFLPKFGEAIRKELGGSVEEASRGAQAAFNRLGNALFDLQSRLASSGLLDTVVDAVRSLTDALNDPALVSGLSQLVGFLSKVMEISLRVASAIGSVVGAVNRAVEAVGNSVFGAMFGQEGTDAIAAARGKQAPVKIPVSPTVDPNYSLGTPSSPGPSGAAGREREKVERLREQLRSRVEGIVQGNFGETNPIEQERLKFEEQLKVLEEALEAKAITMEEYREAELQAELAHNQRLTDIRQHANDLEVSMRERTFNSISSLMAVFAGKNKAIAMAMLVFDKARAIAQATMETHVAAAAALKYDPTGALSARVTALGYTNVAAIAATGIAQLATMGFGGGGGGGDGSGGGVSGTGGSSVSTRSRVFVTVTGREAVTISKNDVREMIERFSDAFRDGSDFEVSLA